MAGAGGGGPAVSEALEAARPDGAAEAHRDFAGAAGAAGPRALAVDGAVQEGAGQSGTGGPDHGAEAVAVLVLVGLVIALRAERRVGVRVWWVPGYFVARKRRISSL